MKKARLATLTLSGAMLLSSSMPVFAAEPIGTVVGFTVDAPCVEYSMTIPTGNTNVATNGDFSSIGNLTVVKKDADFDAKHKLEVTVSHGTEMVKTGATSSATTAITYDLYTGDAKVDDNKVADGDKIEFSAEDINAASGKSVAMGVAISGDNFDTLEPGDYKDTITFTAEVKSAAQVVEYTLTGEEAYSKKLTSTALLESTNQTTFTYESTTYTAYNDYISETSGANWNDGVAFVAALNAAEIDGRTGGWTLLTSKEMAYAWWITTDASEENKGDRSFGIVEKVWTASEDGDRGYFADCKMAWFCEDDGNPAFAEMVKDDLWQNIGKTDSFPEFGFVVLRVSSN